MRKLALVVCLLTVPAAARAAVLHVPADFPTIGAAIAAASPGDEILVASGTYHERFTLDASKDGVKIHSESGPAVTIIDGGYTGIVVTFSSAGPSTEVVGFTIAHGGHVPRTGSDQGGAVRFDQSSARVDNDVITQSSNIFGAIYVIGGSPTINACVIDGNQSQAGGGIYVETGSPAITGNTITNNQAGVGGGGVLAFNHTAPDIENNVIRDNKCGSRGGGLDLVGLSGGVLSGNQIVGNVATSGDGGGAAVIGDDIPISNNVFQSNTAGGRGGGLAIEGVSFSGLSPNVHNNQILGNSGATAAGGIYISGSIPTLTHNLIQDNDCPHGSGGGIYIDQTSSGTFEKNIVLRNHCVAWGGGITIWVSSTPTLTGNTISLNKGDLGGGNVYVRQNSSVTLKNNILSNAPQEGFVSDPVDGANSATFSCNDVSNNTGGNYAGLPDPTGSDGNISSDPLFCDLMTLDVHLSSDSPCTAANAPAGCGLMGALDVNCEGPVRTEVTTWGRMKARYR